MVTKLLLVGEAWGERELKFKHALVGPSGAELARMLTQTGLAPQLHNKFPSEMDMIFHWGKLQRERGIETANVFNTHPPYNNLELFFDNSGDRNLPPLKPGKYIKHEYTHHVAKLWELITARKPNLVVAMGNTACWAILGQTAIGKLRGTVQFSQRLQVKTLPIYHPAAILRDWSLRPITLADLSKASRESEFPEIRRTERWITAHDHVNGIRITLEEIESWLNQPANSYSVDIESGYALFSKAELKNMTSSMRQTLSSQIAMVGFANSANNALVIPFMDRELPQLSYWQSPEEECRAWKLAIRGLKRSVPKIFQNGMYDIGRFAAQGIFPKLCIDDTMLHHHALYPELLKSLGFLGSIYANEISWKQMYDKRESLKRDE